MTGNERLFSTSSSHRADFEHAVIGGGAVGLAVARKLQEGGKPTVLIERHYAAGTETSSRNSEVIHAGIYYGPDSLKTKLCLRGKNMLYDLCKQYDIPYKNCGKWIVAQDDEQMGELEKVHKHCESLGVPSRFVPLEEGKEREPDVRAEKGILESTTTGIIDSHAYMQFLQGDFEGKGGICAFNTPVTRVEPIENGEGGWQIWTKSADEPEESSIVAKSIVNSAGLYAIHLANSILPPDRHKTPFYAKGSYYSYSLSKPKTSTLIYPAPQPGHAGLGTHLTLDMGGKIRFGPDVQWIDDPTDLSVNDSRLSEAIDEIQSYLPGIDREAIGLDYAGVRPKMSKAGAVASGKEFNDFYIRKEEGFEGFVNLLGIESPGLTSSLAIAEEVHRLLYE
ncbi:L-2-hydroxyglutarate dehydrogenase mitochondrial precursor [Aulographum hederae CBS 113979]|uniref:L-2-hydroxyglutarate dehydrogenase, mitochondrial n=1 Tax=Aulographum hederae CBS 113979 TaxID=1176131 RepID=A0A6G1HGS3_9PEZI|nr:L-2-hydroxyglutarate dehydrogenase mitochondrial precursor [Aulographum hederae CBS 113979]